MDSRLKIKAYVTSYSEEVTGSCNHVKVDWPNGRELSFVVDCGLFQEKEHLERNAEKFGFTPSNIAFAIATHVHTDHVGRFPYLVKKGFMGRIYTTEETKQLLPAILNETCDRMQEEYEVALKKYKAEKQAVRKAKLDSKGRGKRDKQRREYTKEKPKAVTHMPVLIFERKDIDVCLDRVNTVAPFETFYPAEGLEVTFYPNAHIGGAVLVHVRAYDENEELNFLFTGDLGMTNPVTGGETIIPDEVCEKIDFVVSEATYGASDGPRDDEGERQRHIKILESVYKKRGTVMYMSNSLERPQKVCADLVSMQKENVFEGIKDFKIYFDSTFGIKCHSKYLKLYGDDYVPEKFQIIDKTTRDIVAAEEGPKMIICTSPRLYQGSFVTYGSKMLASKNVTLIFVAYIPENVRNIVNLPRGTEIDYMGEKVRLMCKMYNFGYYSSHITPEDLDEFLARFKNAKALLFNHGTVEAKTNYVRRYKTDENSTHNLLFGRTVMLTSDGIKKYF